MKKCGHRAVIAGILFFVGLSCTAAQELTTGTAAAMLSQQDETPPTTATLETQSQNEQEDLAPLLRILEERVYPPLSLMDCHSLLQKCTKLVDPELEGLMEKRKDRTLIILTSVLNYIRFYDETRSSLAHYKWYDLGTRKVNVNEVDEDHFSVEKPLKDVHAVTFTSTGVDVIVYRISLKDGEDRETVLFDDSEGEKIFAGMPRREIFFLPFRTELKEITVHYSATEKTPLTRVSALVGVTARPEYGKQSLYYLSTARQKIQDNNFAEAFIHLEKGREKLDEFSKSLQR